MNALFSPPLSSPSTSFSRGDPSGQARNPVALRLYKVLGTKYDDAGTQAALRTLSDFYAPPAPLPASASAGSRHTGNNDEWDAGDSDEDEPPPSAPPVHARLPFLNDAAPSDIAARARRGLRRDAERRLAEGSRAFLAAFRDVDDVCVCAPSACA
jgi:hypothetical protein